MGNFKINSDLFLGSKELNRWQEFIEKKNSDNIGSLIESYGIVDIDGYDQTMTSFMVEKGSIIAGTGYINIKKGLAILDRNSDNKLDYIESQVDSMNILSFQDSATTYYIKAEYAENLYEEGVVHIAANGSVTGEGTKFTEVLRGQPNFPSIIKFDSTLNPAEYEVVRVNNNLNLDLSGTLIAQANVKYKVVGTFTPDRVIPSTYKDIFAYNSVRFIKDTSLNVNSNQVLLATVKYHNGEFTINDMRGVVSPLFSLKSDRKGYHIKTNLSHTTIGNNKVATNTGLVKEKWESDQSDGSTNRVTLAWGFHVDSGDWSYSADSNVITVTNWEFGGSNSISAVTANNFIGYRIYSNDRAWEIVYVQKTGSSSNAKLEFSVRQFENSYAGLLDNYLRIVPKADFINVKVYYTAKNGVPDYTSYEDVDTFTYPCSLGLAEIPVRIAYKKDISFKFVLVGKHFQEEEFEFGHGAYINAEGNGANYSGTFNGIINPNSLSSTVSDNTQALDGFLKLDSAESNTVQSYNDFQGVTEVGTFLDGTMTIADDDSPMNEQAIGKSVTGKTTFIDTDLDMLVLDKRYNWFRVDATTNPVIRRVYYGQYMFPITNAGIGIGGVVLTLGNNGYGNVHANKELIGKTVFIQIFGVTGDMASDLNKAHRAEVNSSGTSLTLPDLGYISGTFSQDSFPNLAYACIIEPKSNVHVLMRRSRDGCKFVNSYIADSTPEGAVQKGYNIQFHAYGDAPTYADRDSGYLDMYGGGSVTFGFASAKAWVVNHQGQEHRWTLESKSTIAIDGTWDMHFFDDSNTLNYDPVDTDGDITLDGSSKILWKVVGNEMIIDFYFYFNNYNYGGSKPNYHGMTFKIPAPYRFYPSAFRNTALNSKAQLESLLKLGWSVGHCRIQEGNGNIGGGDNYNGFATLISGNRIVLMRENGGVLRAGLTGSSTQLTFSGRIAIPISVDKTLIP